MPGEDLPSWVASTAAGWGASVEGACHSSSEGACRPASADRAWTRLDSGGEEGVQRGVHAAQRLQTETKQGLMLRGCENRVKGAREVGGGRRLSKEKSDQEVRSKRVTVGQGLTV